MACFRLNPIFTTTPAASKTAYFKALYTLLVYLSSVTLDIFARDIAIKRCCDKKIILSHGCQKAKVTT